MISDLCLACMRAETSAMCRESADRDGAYAMPGTAAGDGPVAGPVAGGKETV